MNSNTMSPPQTQAELHKFFIVAEVYQQQTGQAAYMPSCAVDNCWHALLEKPEHYQRFCQHAVGKTLEHLPNKGYGNLPWVAIYHNMFGQLDDQWFIRPDGSVDLGAKAHYHKTGQLKMSWDCTPSSPAIKQAS